MPRLDPYTQELTSREKQLAKLMVQGLTNRQIAAQWGMSIKLIEVRATKIYDKLPGLDGFEIPDGLPRLEIRQRSIEFLKTHPHLYEDLSS